MSKALSHSTLSELIGSIYDCAVDPSQWDNTLARIAAASDCTVASLTLNDLRRNRFLLNNAAGWELSLLKRKSEWHVPEINARLTEWLSTQPTLDEPFVASRHLAPDYVNSSAYVRECLMPQGIVDIMHVFLMYTPLQFAELGLGRHERQGAITEREIEIGRLILPHLRRAVTISNILDVRTIERTHMAETLDALRCGVVLTNADCAILHANRVAERMLRDNGPIRDRQGTLSVRTAKARHDLRQAIRLATLDAENQLDQARLSIRLTPPEHTPIYAHVLPLTGGGLRTKLQPDAVAAVFIGTSQDESGADLVAAAFDLTAAETRVLDGLLVGRTLADTAAHLGVALSTAKTHLDHIFAKTGVSRQTGLIRLAMQLTLPVHRPRS